jgi:hypothetical protein
MKQKITIIVRPGAYRKNNDVLVRAYENQEERPEEEEQCVGEVLFRDREPVRFTARFPRGIAAAVMGELSELRDKPLKVQISNEFPSTVGILTSCPENFDGALKRESEEKNLELIWRT